MGEKVPKADEGAVLAMRLPASMFGCGFPVLYLCGGIAFRIYNP